ncbi:MAG: hypothetical protein ACK5HR_01090 [Mycoplasmatales bacterium]
MKKIVLILLLIFFLPIKLLAQDSLYDTETGLITEETTICANKEYTFVQQAQADRALVFLDKNNNYLTSKIINQTEVSLTVPSGLDTLQVIITNVVDEVIDYKDAYKVSYTVEDCGYAADEDSGIELTTTPLAITYQKNMFNATYKDAQMIRYQIQGSKILKTLPETGIEVAAPGIVQLEVKLADGKEKYYEIQLVNEQDYFVREVSTLQTREIKVNTFINFKSIMVLIMTFVLYLYFKVKIRKLKKRRRRQQIRKRNISRKDKKEYKKQQKGKHD